MENTFTGRIKHAWNAFMNKDPTPVNYTQVSTTSRPDRVRFSRGNEKSMITAIYNRIAMDAAQMDIRHVKLDDNDRFLEEYQSGLNNCLSVEANLDQTGRTFIQDVVMSLMDEGCVAICPVDTTSNPARGTFDILTMRTGRILEWRPSTVKIRVYNERINKKQDIWIDKRAVAIIENPLYAVMNEPSSTMQRLVRKLNILDAIDEQSGSSKLDLIIQLPYSLKSDLRKEQAEERRKQIETQLAGSKYGIAYVDATEHITQLNRSVDNNLMNQIEYLTSMLYSQLGITQEVMNGSANEETMLNYYNRTIEPILSAITDEMVRKFLTKTARTQKQSILFFRDLFKLVPVSQMAEISDKLTRNEIATSNEIRQFLGMKPSMDPKADELRNSNMYSEEQPFIEEEEYENEETSVADTPVKEVIQNG